jgi:uncharacterized damage-inducible protein DinB
MKTIFQALAKYNNSVDQSVIEILSPLSKEQIMTKTKAFFPSIYDNLFHIFFSDLFWLKRFKDGFTESKALSGSNLLALDGKSLRKEIEADYTKLIEYRKQADQVILQFIDELAENQLTSGFNFKNFKGEDMESPLWKILLQWFNHQTHHRGGISVLLDMLGVTNDYSSMLNRI